MASPSVAANAYASLAKIMDSAGGASALGKIGDTNGLGQRLDLMLSTKNSTWAQAIRR